MDYFTAATSNERYLITTSLLSPKQTLQLCRNIDYIHLRFMKLCRIFLDCLWSSPGLSKVSVLASDSMIFSTEDSLYVLT